jgi:hypothetical protein
MWIYTSTPHASSWRSAQLVKHRDNFTFTTSVCYLVTHTFLYSLIRLFSSYAHDSMLSSTNAQTVEDFFTLNPFYASYGEV